MHVTCHDNFSPLLAHRDAWNVLARGVPFRTWEWLEAWWRNYWDADGPRTRRELFVLAVWDDNHQLIGVAPWYKVCSLSGARYVRFLGDGEVCTDYLSVLCRPNDEEIIASAVAEWLMAEDASARTDLQRRWDVLDLTGVDAADVSLARLLDHLRDRGATLHYSTALQSWRTMLPETWDDYLKMLSKQQRNRSRRWTRSHLESDRMVMHFDAKLPQLEKAFDVLVDLHQRRWQQRGLPGSFSSRRFLAFHREIIRRLGERGQVQIAWLEYDGKPLAAEYQLLGDGVQYAYQAGIDPDRLDENPGQLVTIAAFQNAIASHARAYDFLRGDEPYKALWRAQPRPMLAVRVIPPRASAWFRHNAWLAGQSVKHWIKQGLAITGRWSSKPPAASRGKPSISEASTAAEE
jgi:CelD/BcsL family acetyltransferase involved in cellulose biosynthesis